MNEEAFAERVTQLLTGRGAFYAMARHGKDNVPRELMRETFPFSRQDVLSYLAERQIPIETFIEEHGMRLLERDGKAIVTEWDERCGEVEHTFPTLDAAREFLTDYCLRHTYTGLDFSR